MQNLHFFHFGETIEDALIALLEYFVPICLSDDVIMGAWWHKRPWLDAYVYSHGF